MEERLQKVLARAGVASRRKAEELILEGRVSVNGHVVRELGTKIDPALDKVAVDTVPIPQPQVAGAGPKTYLLLYKPRGVLCTVKDTHGRITVLHLVPPFEGKRLYPVGRLDEDSEGLVLLTNDGELTARLTHPRYGVPKVYEVRIRGRMTREEAERFERGVWLSEGRTGPSRVFVERTGRDVSHIRITLTEGRNREIRRAFAKLDLPVLSIRRMQIGPVVGRGLEVGQYRPLAPDEIAGLQASAAGDGSNAPMRRSRRTGRPRPGGGGEERTTARRGRGGKPDPALHAPRATDDARGPGNRRGRGTRPDSRGGARGDGERRRPGGSRRDGPYGAPRSGGGSGGARGPRDGARPPRGDARPPRSGFGGGAPRGRGRGGAGGSGGGFGGGFGGGDRSRGDAGRGPRRGPGGAGGGGGRGGDRGPRRSGGGGGAGGGGGGRDSGRGGPSRGSGPGRRPPRGGPR